ncbi:MAG: hypothetical protein Q4G70_15075 [Pseudomonadota bacterium]|nr:hypothetical protein [Pseudomonadota bacterium]
MARAVVIFENFNRLNDGMISPLRVDDGGYAAMTPTECEAFRASLASFRHDAAQRRSHFVIAPCANSRSLERETV